jgi:hypothetical protein
MYAANIQTADGQAASLTNHGHVSPACCLLLERCRRLLIMADAMQRLSVFKQSLLEKLEQLQYQNPSSLLQVDNYGDLYIVTKQLPKLSNQSWAPTGRGTGSNNVV